MTTRSIATVTTTMQLSLTVLDEGKFAAAYADWKQRMSVGQSPTQKQFFTRLATLAAEGNEQAARDAGCSTYVLDQRRAVTTKIKTV